MQDGPGMGFYQRLEARQEMECTIRLSNALEDPIAHAARLFESSRKVNVPIQLGRNTIIVRAALVEGHDLDKIFDGESFGGAIGRDGDPMLFIRRDIQAPAEFAAFMPRLIAFHCISSVKVPRWDDDTGTLAQYQAIALELAYAARLIGPEAWERYIGWRTGIERTDFFQRPDCMEIIGRTIKAFSDFEQGVHRNAHALRLAVLTHGERFRLERGKAIGPAGEVLEVHRKARKKDTGQR